MIERFSIRTLFLLAALGCAPLEQLGAGTPALSVSANRQQLYQGESFQVTLRVEGADRDTGEARFETSSEAAFELLGSSSDSRIYVHTENGRTVRKQTVARVLTYRVTPRASGTFRILQVEIPAGGRVLSAEGLSVQVIGIEPQDLLQVELTASRESVLVEEPFRIMLSVIVRKLPDPNGSTDPFTPMPPPKLEIPWLSQPIPSGLKGEETSELLRPLLASRQDTFGFAINDFTVRNDPFSSPFSSHFDGFGRSSTARFRLTRESVTWQGVPSWRYRIHFRYTAEREGTHTFGPVLLKGRVIRTILPGGRLEGQDIFTAGPAATVRVVPPPVDGRPETFVGTVGSGLSVRSSLDTQLCRQGDPLRLTLEISGNISLSNLRPPQLARQADMGPNFRVYDDAVRTEPIPQGRRFLYSLRPLQAGTLEIPPLAVSYFDTGERAYRTVWTEPIPLRVEEVAAFELGDIIDAVPPGPARTTALRVQTARTTPAAITVTPEGAYPDEALFPPRRILMLLPGPLLVLGSAVFRWFMRKQRTWRRTLRKRSAAVRAARRVRHARTCNSLLKTAALFFEERFDLPSKAFSPMDATPLFHTSTLSDPKVRALLSLLQELFDHSFRPDSPDPALVERARRELPALLAWCAEQGERSPRS